MAGKMISELSDAISLQSTDLIPLARGASTLRIAGSAIATQTNLLTLSANPFVAADTSTIDLNLTNRTLSASVIDSSITNSKLAFDGGSFAFRNKIINGAMRIDQRNAGTASIWNSTAAAAISGFAVDRFRASAISGNTWGTAVLSAQQSTDAPDEFDTSLKLTVNTADTSLAATDVYAFVQPIEGNNISDLGFGTATAKPITISFWVKSSITGTYCVSFSNNAQNRSLVDAYIVNAANTWEYKYVTINADTTGTWLTDSNAGLFVRWDLGSGSNLQTATTDTWQGALYTRTSGSVNWVSTTGATFFITGVQVEKGTVATPFEQRPIGTELALCQRYYQASDDPEFMYQRAINNSTAFSFCSTLIIFPVIMRTGPTVTTSTSNFTPDPLGPPSGANPTNRRISYVGTCTNSTNTATVLNWQASAEF
jgi:hypothetical protein